MCVVLDDVVGPQHVCQREISIHVFELGIGHGVIDGELAPGEPGEEIENVVHALGDRGFLTVDQLVYRDRAGVDHRVERAAGLVVERQLVEGLARGFDIDDLEHPSESVLLERGRIDEWLRHRLDGELRRIVAGAVDVPVRCAHGNGEERGIDLGQLGNIVGDLAAAGPRAVAHELVEVIGNRSAHSRPFACSRNGPRTYIQSGSWCTGKST